MATKHLNIPNDLSSKQLTRGTDDIQITVTADCSWCYSDPNNVFANGFLAAGSYTATSPHTTYGPYTPANDGTVTVNAVTSGNCTTAGVTATPHTITVTGGN
jgi:hypothetical protein